MSAYLNDRKLYERAGFKWWLNSNEAIDRAIIDDHCWERAGTNIVLARVKPGMVCVDVGANIGYYTLLLSRQVGATGTVRAFEPMEEPYEILRRHLRDNGCTNVRTARTLISNYVRPKAATTVPYSCPREGAPANIASEAPTHTLDALQGRVDFIKIDVDGHELHVLRGAERLLRVYRPDILFEVGDWFLRHHAGISEDGYRYGDATRALFDWLERRGYTFRWEGTPDVLASAEDLLKAHDLEHNTINVLGVWRG